MPELPEVETVRRGLLELLSPPCVIDRLDCRQPRLRRPVPIASTARLAGSRLRDVRRRAKYLLFDCGDQVLINHLGMTGSWRSLAPGEAPAKHDHLLLALDDGRRLAFRDPRRFGLIDCCPAAELAAHPLLTGLGPEPLDDWNGSILQAACRGRRAPIKSLLLDQRLVAGIGNIYAAEACFRAGIDPRRAAGSLGPRRCQRLVTALRAVLREAIAAGGSTISDFRQAGGDEGYFQHDFQVYGREGQPCCHCGRRLRGAILAGRSTVWCSRCQG